MTESSFGVGSIPLECKSIISKAFSPNVSVTVSQDVDDICKEMGFESFLDLLQPFGDKISGRITVCDSQGISTSFDDFAIRFREGIEVNNGDLTSGKVNLTSTTTPPNSTLPQLFINDDLETYLSNKLTELSDNNIKLTPELSNNLYHDFFKRVLSSPSVVPFETFNHPVTGVIAVSSRNDQPIDTLSTLYKHSHDPKLIPDFINKDYLRYYVLVHDESRDELEKSIALFEKMKRNFGLHCHMIRINRSVSDIKADKDGGKEEEKKDSKEGLKEQDDEEHKPNPNQNTENTNDEPSLITLDIPEWLSLSTLLKSKYEPHTIRIEDYKSLQLFVRELVVQSVLPFMERCIATWNDQVASSRRGITGRFFSASKKYFASSTRATSSILSTASGSSPFYFSLGSPNQTPSQSTPGSRSPTPPTKSSSPLPLNSSSKYSYNYLTPEAQIRKLADFAFMLRDYKFAYTTYDLLKRDFHNDKAWSYLAGCEEMAAISYLITNDTLLPKLRTDLIDPLLDSSTYSYISRCLLPSYALRCILLSSELLCTLKTPSAASDGSTKWILKALNERLVGRLGYAILMERISGAYSSYDDIAEKNIYSSGIVNTSSTSLLTPHRSSTPASITSNSSNSSKIIPTSIHTSRSRKAAFWQLLAAREWSDANVKNKSRYCIEQANEMAYKDLEWSQRSTGLLYRLSNN